MRTRVVIGGLVVSLGALASVPGSASTDERRLYELTTNLNMPHLEENLRYAITHEQRCLALGELHRLFPILQHPALAGCSLGPESANAQGQRADLVCEGNHGTTGAAQWQAQPPGQIGVLHIRLGGKNMTFSQTVTARDLGHC